jgi:hypothetical protein
MYPAVKGVRGPETASHAKSRRRVNCSLAALCQLGLGTLPSGITRDDGTAIGV